MGKFLTTEEKNAKALAKRHSFLGQLDHMWFTLQIGCPYPGLDEISKMVDMCTTTRGNKFRFIETPRKSEEDSLLFNRLRYHKAIDGKNKTTKTTWKVDKHTYDKLDTFARLMSVCQGNINKEWAKLLGMYATK
jgi:hypothetical protein